MKTAIKWGAILGVAVCVWTLIIHVLGFYTTNQGAGQKADLAATILPVAAIVLSLRERRRLLGRGLRIAESLGYGVLTGLVSAPITAGFLWWYHHFLNPQWLDLLIVYQHSTMVAAGKAAADIARMEAAQRLSGTDSAQLIGAFVGTTIFSALISLVAAFFVRRAPLGVGPTTDPSLRSG